MAVQPVASDHSIEELGNVSWTGAALDDAAGKEEVPGAEPREEEVDVVPEPGAQNENLCEENCQRSTMKLAHDDALKGEQPIEVSHDDVPTGAAAAALETALENAEQTEGSQACQKWEKSLDLVQDSFPSSSPRAFRLSPTEGCTQAEDWSSLEGELAEWISDAEAASDQADEEYLLPSSDSEGEEWPLAPPDLPEPAVNRAEEKEEEEMEGRAKPEEEEEEALSQSYRLDSNEPERTVSEATVKTRTVHFPADAGVSPFADEAKDKEHVSAVYSSMPPEDVSSAWKRRVNSSKPVLFIPISSQPSPPASTTTTQSAVSSGKQQRGQQQQQQQQQQQLLLQSQPEHDPMGVNQEAAQQVHGSQSLPPLVAVAVETANRGPAGTLCSACSVVAVGELKASWAGRDTEQQQEKAESRQTVGQSAAGGLDTDEAEVEKEKSHTEEERVFGFRTRAESLEDDDVEGNSTISISKRSRTARMESDIYDDSQSDSGLSADFSPCGTLETPTTDTATTGPPETPIEKEIRRAVEREGSLRRSRGLQVAAVAPQYVEIPLRRSVLGPPRPSSPAKSERNQGKDRHYAGKKMQREIHADTQREQDLVKIGTVSGGYDRGTVRQLRERQKLFEVFQEAAGPSFALSARSKAPPSPWGVTSPGDLSVPENRGGDAGGSSAASTPRGSFSERRRSSSDLLLLSPVQSPSPMLGPGFSEGADCQVIILESNDVRLYYSEPRRASDVVVIDGAFDPPSSSLAGEFEGDLLGFEEEEEEEGVEEEEEEEAAAAPPNPFFKLRSSAAALDKVGRDIREAQDRERELRKQRGCLYGGGGGRGGGRGASRGGDVTPVSTAPPPPPPPPPLLLNGLTPPDPPVQSSRRATGPSTAARQSLCRLGVMWPPAHTEDQQLVCPESPPWTPRQKTPLLQRWELGLVNGHGDGDREEDN